jgi:hypothetical protein
VTPPPRRKVPPRASKNKGENDGDSSGIVDLRVE